MRFLLCILLFLAVKNLAIAQNGSLQKIKGLPTEEVYDVFADSKGYIWAGHSLGISRYDGIGFTSFNCPDQTALGITRICEDKEGRIWCHNFNGQVFYIQDEQMHLFEQYNANTEISFPDMLIHDSELIITSLKGIFVCNTKTMQGRYLRSKSGIGGSRTLTLNHEAVITFDSKTAHKYTKDKGFIEIPIIPVKGILYEDRNRAFNIVTINASDTIYGYNNETNDFFKFIEKNDSLWIVSSEKVPGMINTVVKCNDTIWINTKEFTYSLNGTKKIIGKNISDLVKDKTGNIWISSLQGGLSANMFYNGWKKQFLPFLPKGDFIRAIVSADGNMLYGTQKGKVIIYRDGKVLATLSLPAKAGSVESIHLLPNNRLVIAPSLGLYLANTQLRKLYAISDIGTLKSIALTDTSFLLAYAQTLARIPITPVLRRFLASKKVTGEMEDAYAAEFKEGVKIKEIYLRDLRCYLVNFDSLSKKTYAIFKTGLTEIINDSIIEVAIHKKPVSTTCLIQNNHKVYIGTLNNGLYIKSKQTIQNISSEAGLISNTIIQMKLFENHLLLMEPDYLQIWDITKGRISATIPLPKDNAGVATEVLFNNGTVYLTFAEALYQLKLADLGSNSLTAYLLQAISSDKNISKDTNPSLDYHDNNIQFVLSSPSYLYPEATYFLYRLKGSSDDQWKKINGPVFRISFASLSPRNYQFEAYAVNFQGIRSSETIVYQFSVLSPIWLRWWFISLFGLLAIGLFNLFIFQRIRSIKKRDALVIDKLTLQNDLRKSLLKTIVAQMNPHFIFNALNTIQSFVYKNDKRSVSNYMGKFSGLIRKILDTSNLDLISLEEELEILYLYLDLEKARFEEDLFVSFHVDPDIDPAEITIPPMFIQPYIENAIKHGLFHKKSHKFLEISIGIDNATPDYLIICVEDNGIGRKQSMEINKNAGRSSHTSFATSALQNRINLINQTLDREILIQIEDKINHTGTIVRIQLPIIRDTL